MKLSEQCWDNWQGDKSVHLLVVLLGQLRGEQNSSVGPLVVLLGQSRGELVYSSMKLSEQCCDNWQGDSLAGTIKRGTRR